MEANATEVIYCVKCGQQNLKTNSYCTRCGFALHNLPPPLYVTSSDNTMGGLIPYKNARALWAYYLGVFSLIPCAGIPLGVAALILGIKGLKFLRLHPASGGKYHAWTGIILGAFCSIIYLALLVVIVMIRK